MKIQRKIEIRRKIYKRLKPRVSIVEHKDGSVELRTSVTSKELFRDSQTGNYIFADESLTIPNTFEVERGVHCNVRVAIKVEAVPTAEQRRAIDAITGSERNNVVSPE